MTLLTDRLWFGCVLKRIRQLLQCFLASLSDTSHPYFLLSLSGASFIPSSYPKFSTSLPYPCSQSILPTPVATVLFLDPFFQPQFLAPVPNLFLFPCSASLFPNSAPYPCCLLLFLILFSILVPCSLFPSSFSLHMLQPLFPTFFHLPRFPASVHYSCSQPLFLILASNFCCLSLFPVCFNLFPTPVPNLQSQLLPPNGKFDCSSFCILQARVAFDKKEFQKAETFLLRAQRPELSARYYKVP